MNGPAGDDLAKKAQLGPPDLKKHYEKCKQFLREFEDESGERKYMQMLQRVANRELDTIEIHLADLQQFAEDDAELMHAITSNTMRYVTLFSDVADEVMPAAEHQENMDVYDIWLNQRIQRMAAVADENFDAKSQFPKELTRRYQMLLLPSPTTKHRPLRSVRSGDVGSLVTLKGVVTRVSDVQPLLQVATYTCQTCGFESYQPVNDRSYNPLSECPSPECKANETKGELYHQTRGSKFIPYQEIRLQELPREVPVGHIPRSVTLKCFGKLTRLCTPGHMITVDGIFLPAPYQGFRAIKAGLTTETYVAVTRLESNKKGYDEFKMSAEEEEEIEEASRSDDVYENLASSIAPEIFGMTDVKKALLLLLVGGVERNMKDGMNIRGDINVLLMGDPGVAKSQLLKHIAHVSPRGVYTTGKGSSGVGLTAAVLRDPITSEMTLEGGALVLADKGICCIDEFDKMEEGDRTAIHEVMEQQTVSIAKAGITTTLNARTCILAAANPVYGRWNPKLSPERNLGLAPALLSRFDLCFKLLDKPNDDFDRELAKHVCYVHTHESHPVLEFKPYSSAFLRGYIAKARELKPWVPQELADFVIGSYLALRQDDGSQHEHKYQDKVTNTRAAFTTARSLLSVLRLSQALARIKFRDRVAQEDVEEAMRLMHAAKNDDDDDDANKGQGTRETEKTARVFNIIKDFANNHNVRTVKIADVRQQIITRGYSDELLGFVLDQYEDLGVWTLSTNRQIVRFMHGGDEDEE
jgi:DNA replication licensing factor MCM7